MKILSIISLVVLTLVMPLMAQTRETKIESFLPVDTKTAGEFYVSTLDKSVKLDDGLHTTSGISVIISERCLRAINAANAKYIKRNRKHTYDSAFTITELPDRFRIAIVPWDPERGHTGGFGGSIYDVSKTTNQASTYGGWR